MEAKVQQNANRRTKETATTTQYLCHMLELTTSNIHSYQVHAGFWNTLPSHIVQCTTLQSFKKHLRQFLYHHSTST